MAAWPGLGDLIGRDDELSVIGEMLRDTGGRGLLLVGEPGIGKSALLHAASAMAARDGRAVLRAAAVQAETGVPYAGLHQLLYPLAGRVESLAPRPREALRAAFGQADGPPPEMFPVAVATLELLASAADGPGLLVVADDLHWMDDATLEVLRFVARRIASVPIALLAAIRHGFEDVLVEADLPVLMLRPLDVDEIGGLTALPRLLAQQARSAIVLASPSLWQAPEMIGRTDEAREILAAFRPAEFRPAERDGMTAWTRVALLYAAPLLADEDAAEQEFRRALEANLVRWPFYRARLLLEYGSWLRRRRRIAEARAPLRHAHQVCEAHGLLPWAERALAELRASGEGRAAFRAEERGPLSPQELQIAQLAAAGLSNREIGQRLYLSHRTIGSHLYRIFPKLGITSRAQLGSALAAG